jgi:hypothetical protein
MDETVFQITPTIGVCLISEVFGLASFVAGYILFRMRRTKIRKIFAETSVVDSEAG